MRITRHMTGFGVALLLAVAFSAVPAHATVHEIVAQWCSGHDELGPPGISDPTRRNFAQPLNANGFIGPLVAFDGPAGPGLLITFNYDLPAAKVVGTGEFFVVGEVNGAPLYLEGIEPNPEFAAFAHCPRLAG